MSFTSEVDDDPGPFRPSYLGDVTLMALLRPAPPRSPLRSLRPAGALPAALEVGEYDVPRRARRGGGGVGEEGARRGEGRRVKSVDLMPAL